MEIDVAPPQPVAKVAARRRKVAARNPEQIDFGSCWLTQRRDAGRNIVGYQATCTKPAHQLQGRCTRELTVGKVGSADIAVRQLKAWIVLYSSSSASADRAAHRSNFAKVAKLKDRLPSEADLDSLAPADWPAAAQPAAEAEA